MDGPTLKAALRDALTALIKLALVGDAPQNPGWRAEAAAAQKLAGEASAAVDLASINLDDLWGAAVKRAEADPAVRRGESVNPTLPVPCPLRADEVVAVAFDLDRAVATIRSTASFG